MPYTPEHKLLSRNRILVSAFELFTQRGYESVTIDDIMENCAMTRGGFYAHFKCKSELYREAIAHAFSKSKLSESQYSHHSEKERLTDILNGYLSLEHVQGINPCPLAFLASDIALRDKATRKVFSDAFNQVNQLVFKYASTFLRLSQEDVMPLTAMVVGTVALARTMDNPKKIETMLAATRNQVDNILGITLE